MKDIYNENFKILWKNFMNTLEYGKTSHIPGLQKLILKKHPFYNKPSMDLL